MGNNRRSAAMRLGGMLVAAGLATSPALASGGAPASGHPAYDQYRTRVTIPMGTTLRNFQPSVHANGHPDFGRLPQQGSGRYARVAAAYLDSDLKPVLATTGFRVLTDWKDGLGRAVIPTKPYIDARPGDTPGLLSATQGGAVLSAASFAQWFQDVAGVNTRTRGDFTVTWEPANGVYAFDGSLDNSFGATPDYSYTCELHAPFIYEAGKDWYVSAATNGDVFVFIDGRLVLESACGVPPYASLAVNDSITMSNTASIVGLGGVPVAVSSNSASGGDIQLSNAANIAGDVMCGPGGNPASVIKTSGTAAIAGSRGSLSAPIPMPEIPEPGNLGASIGDLVYSGGVHSIAGSFRARTITTNGSAVLNISGDVTILVEEKLDFGNSSRVVLLPGARLTIFVLKDFYLHNAAMVNVEAGDPTRMTLVSLGTAPVVLDNGGEFVGRIIAPTAQVDVGNAITVTGAILADNVRMYNSGRLVGAVSALDGLPGMDVAMMQRIDLDRLSWLEEDRTHQISFFFANRLSRSSYLRFETNMELLNVALVPEMSERD